MAYKHLFNSPHAGLPFVWNVSAHVGCAAGNPNRPTDVELVQFLCRELIAAGVLGATAPSDVKTPALQLTGRFDAILGFWIWLAQDSRGTRSETIDGIVSPARGISYGAGRWLIATLNGVYRERFPNEWSNLNRDTRLSAALRADLTRTSP